MNFLYDKSFSLISQIIDSLDYKSDEFYFDVLYKLNDMLSGFHDKSFAIVFIDDSNCYLKSAVKNGIKFSEYNFNNTFFSELNNTSDKYLILKTQKDTLLFNNTLIFKLAIRDSVYGYIIFSLNEEFEKELVFQLSALASVISYKIKDFELNEVFKIQIKAMQDAVCEKNEAYEIIKKQHKKLQELDKTKNLFLANISHELRTPLNAIIGFSQALGSEIFGKLNDKQSEYIKDIQVSGLHLLGMINEILDISKLEAHAMKFTPSNINIKQTVQEVVNILEPLYKDKNINLEFDSEFNGEIYADYQKFRQILFNLLSNAIKFTPNGGKIAIKSYAKNKNYYLEIADTGIGIDKKYHNKIFKKFVHLNNAYIKTQSSTGLGLTITKELVKLHKGKIYLESELNKGSTFKMEFKNIIV